jgi:CPA1 family monovalent cation:H+ antiporter
MRELEQMIVLTAFAVVVGTLVIQGLTLKPLLRALNVHADDPVGRELRVARERALREGLASFADDGSPLAEAVRREFTAHLTSVGANAENERRSAFGISRTPSARPQGRATAVLALRANDEIGDDAFHRMEEELGLARNGMSWRWRLKRKVAQRVAIRGRR